MSTGETGRAKKVQKTKDKVRSELRVEMFKWYAAKKGFVGDFEAAFDKTNPAFDPDKIRFYMWEDIEDYTNAHGEREFYIKPLIKDVPNPYLIEKFHGGQWTLKIEYRDNPTPLIFVP